MLVIVLFFKKKIFGQGVENRWTATVSMAWQCGDYEGLKTRHIFSSAVAISSAVQNQNLIQRWETEGIYYMKPDE